MYIAAFADYLALAAMKRFLLPLLLLLAGHASAATLDKHGIVGTWVTQEPHGVVGSIAHFFNGQPSNRLEIKEDLSVKLTRQLGDDKEQVLSAPPSMVTFHEDLMIVKFSPGTGAAKLVLYWLEQQVFKALVRSPLPIRQEWPIQRHPSFL